MTTGFVNKSEALREIIAAKEKFAPTQSGAAYKDKREGISIAMRVIANMPPSPVRGDIKGEWIMPTNGEDGRIYRECTVCHRVVLYGWLYEFCGHCGANMKKVDKKGYRGYNMNELDRLRKMLDDAGIPYDSVIKEHDDEIKKIFNICDFGCKYYGDAWIYDRNQVIYGGRADTHEWKFDAIYQYGSYDARFGKIETYGELGAGKDGQPQTMTADEAFEIIRKDWEANGKVED